MPSPNTAFLLAGHGHRLMPQPLPIAVVAQRIVDSITLHAAQGVMRRADEYTSRAETLAAVEELLKGESICE